MIYGIDIGGTKIEFVAFDSALEPVHRRRVPTPADDYDQFLTVLADLVAEADASFGQHPSVGLGVPGLVDHDGRALCANLPGVTGHHVAPDVAARIGRPVTVSNDTRCFALSEAIGGAGAGHHIMFGAVIGTGAAGGLIIDRRIEAGQRGLAGEYGHLPLPASIQQKYGLPIHKCGCGLMGCFETYVAGPHLVALAAHFDLKVDNASALVAAWRAETPEALRTRSAFLDILGAAFANVVKLCDPGIIVMGGGVSLIPEVIDLLPQAIGQHLFPGFPPPPVVPALFGDASGVRGAALLAREDII